MLTSTSSGPGFATVPHQHGRGRHGLISSTRNLLVLDRTSGFLDDLSPLLLWNVGCHYDVMMTQRIYQKRLLPSVRMV